jgi:glycosyltransferase involved in cell wall biosynthesis
MSRNIIPLLPYRQWEVSRADRPRLLAMQGMVVFWARFARQTICVSHDAQVRLARLARVRAERLRVIPHGVRPYDEVPACSTRELEAIRSRPYLLYVGQPAPYRRTRELFLAYSELSARRTDIPPLVVIGSARAADAAYERECMRCLEPAIQRKQVLVLGQLDHDDVLALMAKAHAFLYPSVHENCPNVVLEALAAGRVAVYADIPPVRELAADAGIFVDDLGGPSLVEAIERASFDDGLRRKIATAARCRAGHFTWERAAKETVAVLDSVLDG